MIYIFLDANFLLVPAQFDVNVYEEIERLVPKPYEIIVMSAIFTELELKLNKSPKKTKLGRQYRFGRQLLDKYTFTLVEKERTMPGSVDNFLLSEAILYADQGHRVYLATNDKELRAKCLRNGVRGIFLRQKKFLGTEEE